MKLEIYSISFRSFSYPNLWAATMGRPLIRARGRWGSWLLADINYVIFCWGFWDLVVEINSVIHRKGWDRQISGDWSQSELRVWTLIGFFGPKSDTNKAMNSYESAKPEDSPRGRESRCFTRGSRGARWQHKRKVVPGSPEENPNHSFAHFLHAAQIFFKPRL